MKKEMKLVSIVFLVVLSVILISQFVLAQNAADTAAEGTKGVIKGIGELLTPLFGEKMMLSRIFLAILLGLIIYDIMPLILGEDRRTLSFIISVVVTILAMISIPTNFIDAIVLQYGAMGAAILSVIPFAIILITSVRIQNALIARVLWLFYVVYYFALYIYKLFSSTATDWISGETIPYLGAIVAGIVMFIFIVSIRKIVFKGEMSALKETGEQIAGRGKLLHKLQKEELEGSYGAPSS